MVSTAAAYWFYALAITTGVFLGVVLAQGVVRQLMAAVRAVRPARPEAAQLRVTTSGEVHAAA